MCAHKFFIWFGLKTQFGAEKSLSVKGFFKLKLVTFLKGQASVGKCLNTLVYLQRKVFQESFSFSTKSCTFVFHIV